MAALELLTITQVAKQIGVTPRQAEYAVSRYAIPETCRVGITRLFDKIAIERIEATVKQIGERRHPVNV